MGEGEEEGGTIGTGEGETMGDTGTNWVMGRDIEGGDLGGEGAHGARERIHGGKPP